MNDLRHLSREEQKLLADVAKLVREDEQEFNYDMLKIEAPEQASGEFWFRMAEMLSTLPPNQSLDLRMNGGRLTVAVSILSVLLQDIRMFRSFGHKKSLRSTIWLMAIKLVQSVWRSSLTKRPKPMRKNIWRKPYRKTCFPL